MGDLKFVASHDTRFKMRSDSRVLLLQPHLPIGTTTMTVAWGVGGKSSVLDSKVKTVCPEQRRVSVQPPSLISPLSCYCLWPEVWGPEDLCFNPS